MECKVCSSCRTAGHRRNVLIETSCNVKESAESTRLFPDRVLIETSWNVKGYPDDKKTKFVGVLIETSWNVKDALKKLSGMSHLY